MLSQTCLRSALQARAIVFCVFILCLDCATHAQQSTVLMPVVVTATRTETPLADVLSDITIIEREQIDRSGAFVISDVLSHLPGVSISQTGGPASTTGVFIRGAESRFTAVFVDGIRIDSQSTGGAPWEAIPLAQVDRIEVLRGPAAAIYGSDAVAGVVQIFTRKGKPGFSPSIAVGLGSYNTTKINTSVRGGEGRLDYALGIAEEKSTGFNAQPSSSNTDKDGFKNQSFSGRMGLKLDANQQVDLSVLDNVLHAGYDAYGSLPPTTDVGKQHLQTLGLNWGSAWSELWTSRLGWTQGTDRYESSPSVYITQTQVSTYLFHNELKWGPGTMTADLERREDRLQNAGTQPSANTLRAQNALALGYGLKLGFHALQANARHDVNSQFGTKSTGALNYGYAITPEWRVTASAATAFRAPTLYQRFSVYGVASLLPETSNNKELGLRWASDRERASLVVYQNDVNNLINYVSGAGSCLNGVGMYAGCYGNTGHARMGGATLSAATLVGQVKLGGSLDLMKPKNQDTGKYLARRARQQFMLTADVPLLGWTLGTELQYVGERFDDAANATRLAPYSWVNLTANKPIDGAWRFIARLNNVTNRFYQLANGYATPGFNAYIGLTWQPKD